MSKINTINDCLIPLFVLMSMVWIPIAAKWDDYNPGAGGIKWLPNCDYPGFDISSQPITAEQCGRACMDTVGCNAFSWHDGWCYLKKKPANLNRSPLLIGGRCGFLPWEFDETSTIIQQPRNNFAKSIVNPNSQLQQQQIYPQHQLSPRKSQIKPQNNFQVGSSKKFNNLPLVRRKQNNPNVESEMDDSDNNYDDSDGRQDEGYHSGEFDDDDTNRQNYVDQNENQSSDVDNDDDNQLGDADDSDNQPADEFDNDDNLPDNDVYYDSQPEDQDY